MKIKMKTTSAGPDPAQNWHEGQIREVDPEYGHKLIKLGLATLHGHYAAKKETAMSGPEEMAVLPKAVKDTARGAK